MDSLLPTDIHTHTHSHTPSLAVIGYTLPGVSCDAGAPTAQAWEERDSAGGVYSYTIRAPSGLISYFISYSDRIRPCASSHTYDVMGKMQSGILYRLSASFPLSVKCVRMWQRREVWPHLAALLKFV